MANGIRITLKEAVEVELTPPGSRILTNQRYTLHGEARTVPGGWNGEGIRGSGGEPYQRMVPGSLRVYGEDRQPCYRENVDYVVDWYMGTIKRNPEGSLRDGQLLSLDYQVWLCRYDTIVILRNGEIQVIEGMTEPYESRELLLPDPPAVTEGVPLANVFLGWGQQEIHDGQVSVELYSGGNHNGKPPAITGRFEDMMPRDYYVEILDVSSEDPTFTVRMAMSGEDYGTGQQLEAASLRWSEPVLFSLEDQVPLMVPSAYGKGVDWGLAVSFASLEGLPERGACYKISAKPHMLMDRRTSPRDPLHFIERERFPHLAPVMERMRNGQPVRIAFYGESTTRSGRWPYEVAHALRTQFPACALYTSNVAVSGESSMRGIARLQDEVLSLKPDLVMIEYFINDGYSGETEASERSLRAIIEGCRRAGACCLLLTNNGRNPIFSESGSRRETYRVHEQMKRIAQETQIAFVGGYSYFFQLHLYGRYFLTELKGNMLNHPYGNVDPGWGSFDRVLADAILKGMDSC
ncbi:hypothetical protein MJA45_20040 [Paenibacillus aurantius]|uniref:SGNH hydrolase-type esterase domain-containing protein n=1 Tax=Paenibacillus aurantius TaxID=2918900 RepID=A0AA96RBX8_9BACL|nr:GDSL-type esterase/lipase family protein [Paenibacillus aurantius]WNQ09895.1 hypothetical protein MJA45_20040 [Paenibacillus aurantius]